MLSGDEFLIDILILPKVTKVRLPNPPSQPRDMILNFQLVDYNGFHRNGILEFLAINIEG